MLLLLVPAIRPHTCCCNPPATHAEPQLAAASGSGPFHCRQTAPHCVHAGLWQKGSKPAATPYGQRHSTQCRVGTSALSVGGALCGSIEHYNIRNGTRGNRGGGSRRSRNQRHRNSDQKIAMAWSMCECTAWQAHEAIQLGN